MQDSRKRTRLWSSLSLAALVGSGGAAASTGFEPGPAAAAPAASQALSWVGGEGGEGEGEGEGEGGAAPADPVSSDQVYLTRLGLIRGHLHVGVELFRAGRLEQARSHMKHPRSELYADLEPAFAARDNGGFGDALARLSSAVGADEPSAEAVEAAYADLLAGITAAEAAAGADDAYTTLQVAASLIRSAAREYALGVDADGKVVNGHEYQDALGFTRIARARIEALRAGDDDSLAGTRTRVLGHIDAVFTAGAWPSLVPPERVEVAPSLLFGTAARIEIAALGLR